MTIKDLAAKTGYAVGTVSRALNDQPNVSEKARAAILKAAEECGFELNRNAKQLKQQHSNTILVVVKGIGNELFGGMIETIQSLLAPTRYQLVVDYGDEDSNEVRRALRLCQEKKPLGILFLGGNNDHFRQDFSKIDIPCVLVTGDGSALPFPNLSSVTIDDRAATRSAMELLISLGHRNIAVIGGDRAVSDISRLRYSGCLDALQGAEAEFLEDRDYHSGHFSYSDGYHAMQTLLRRRFDYTAVFALADVMAIGAIRALRDNDLSVPGDVSVMGVDGLSLGDFLVPQLATVSQPAGALAERSVAILLSMIEEKALASHEQVPFAIHARESIRPL